MPTPQPSPTNVAGLAFAQFPVGADDEGWSGESWALGAPAALGLREVRPVRQTVRRFDVPGTTTGFRAESGDRVIQVVAGELFGAWVDLRPGLAFGASASARLVPGSAVVVPAGVGHALQVLVPGSIVVTLHGEPLQEQQAQSAVHPFDPSIDVPWPIGRAHARVSTLDVGLPPLDDVPQTPRRAAPAVATPVPARAAPRPMTVLFVCTANICRSAYADVVARARAAEGVRFASAGIQALVGHGIDPEMAQQLRGIGDPASHVARQLTQQVAEEADLILTMAGEHRRFILDVWPAMGRKTFVLGQAARVLSESHADVPRDGLVELLRSNRASGVGDDVRDPYRLGPEAAAASARKIDGLLDVLLATLRRG